MTEQQKENLLISIREMLDKQNQVFKILDNLNEKIENRDELLISLIKEVALLRNEIKNKN